MKTLIVSLGLLAICAGCETRKPQTDVYACQNATAKINHVEFKQVSLENFRADTVAVKDIRRSKTNDGYQRIQVFVTNLTKQDIRVAYRFNWEDENGVEIEDLDHAGWQYTTVRRGDQPAAFSSIAPSEKCHDFRFRVKPVVKAE